MSLEKIVQTTIFDFAYEKQGKVCNNDRNAFEGVEIKSQSNSARSSLVTGVGDGLFDIRYPSRHQHQCNRTTRLLSFSNIIIQPNYI